LILLVRAAWEAVVLPLNYAGYQQVNVTPRFDLAGFWQVKLRFIGTNSGGSVKAA
jgi:hypothetical protein